MVGWRFASGKMSGGEVCVIEIKRVVEEVLKKMKDQLLSFPICF